MTSKKVNDHTFNERHISVVFLIQKQAGSDSRAIAPDFQAIVKSGYVHPQLFQYI